MSRPEFVPFPDAAARPLTLRSTTAPGALRLDRATPEPIEIATEGPAAGHRPGEESPLREKERVRQAARQFEAVFMSYLYKTMRETVPDSPFASGESGSMYEDLFTQSLGVSLAGDGASGRGLGLAELLVKSLDPVAARAALHSANIGAIGPKPPPAAAPTILAAAPADRLFVENHRLPRKEFPVLADNVREAIDEAAESTGVDRHLLHAVVLAESGGNPKAESRRGARGLMQLMERTARELGVGDVFDPRQNVLAGARYLKRLLLTHGGDERLALASYNAGPGNVRRHGGVPPFKETIQYIERVLDIRQKLGGGKA